MWLSVSAQKIHLSEATKNSLEQDRDGKKFILTPRGEIEVKVSVVKESKISLWYCIVA